MTRIDQILLLDRLLREEPPQFRLGNVPSRLVKDIPVWVLDWAFNRVYQEFQQPSQGFRLNHKYLLRLLDLFLKRTKATPKFDKCGFPGSPEVTNFIKDTRENHQ